MSEPIPPNPPIGEDDGPPVEQNPDEPVVPVDDFVGWNESDVVGERVKVEFSPVIAGDPDGARVEVAADGLHAYNAANVETATIRGDEGVFVGGEFRTSDTLPGQVRLADDGYVTDLDGGGVYPGIGITPLDDTDMVYPAGIGPSENGVTIYGGRRTTGGSSVVHADPAGSLLRTFRADGTTGGEVWTSPTASIMRTSGTDGAYGVTQTNPDSALLRARRADGSTSGEILVGATSATVRKTSGVGSEQGWVRANPNNAELASINADNGYRSRVTADQNEAYLFTNAGGVPRYLTVDSTGVWVKTVVDGSAKWYNLEKTAQDSGWVNLALSSAHTAISSGAAFQYRLMGNLIHLRGRVGPAGGGSYAMGSEYTLVVLPGAIRPAVSQRQIIAGGTATQWGRMDINAGTGALTIASMSGTSSWMDLTGITWTLD